MSASRATLSACHICVCSNGKMASHDRCFLGVPLLYFALSTPIGLFIKRNKHFKNAAQVLIWALFPLGGCFEPEEAQRGLCDQAGMWRMKAPFSGLPTSQVWGLAEGQHCKQKARPMATQSSSLTSAGGPAGILDTQLSLVGLDMIKKWMSLIVLFISHLFVYFLTSEEILWSQTLSSK